MMWGLGWEGYVFFALLWMYGALLVRVSDAVVAVQERKK